MGKFIRHNESNCQVQKHHSAKVFDSQNASTNFLYCNKLNPLLISPLPPPNGGISIWSERYIEYCKKNGIDIQLVNTALIGKRSENAAESFSFVDEIKRSFKIWNSIKRKTRNNTINVAHLNTNCSPKGLIRDFLSSKILKRRHIKFVVHCRCNVQDQIKTSKIGLLFFKKICKMASAVFVQNSSSLDYVKSLKQNNVILMPNCITKDFISQKKFFRKNIEKVAFIGHIKKSKGVQEIIDVAAKMCDINFYLAGLISESGITCDLKNVHFLGDISSNCIKELLDDSDILLFPTHTEGFSNSLLEAMARGLPSITTNVGANNDMIENKGGVILQDTSVDSITQAINYVSDVNIRKAMSLWCVEKVNSSYTTEKVFLKIFKIYNAILNQ